MRREGEEAVCSPDPWLRVFVSRGGIVESGMVEWELGKAISGAYEVDDDGEMEVVERWGGVEDVVSEDEGEWEVGDLTLDGKKVGELDGVVVRK